MSSVLLENNNVSTTVIDNRRQTALLGYYKKLTELRQNENTLKDRLVLF